jgi:serine-type D-Ala-D-Ala carboxypeptidase/endopeptidase (penicillin-binding protein 4)
VRRRGGGTWLVVALAVAALGVLAGAVLAGVRGGDPTRPPIASAQSPLSSPPVRGALVAPAGDGVPVGPAGLAAALRIPLADKGLGRRVGLSVVDVTTGAPLLERAPARAAVPASTTKIVTAAAVLLALDPAARLTTRVVAGAAPGDVVLVGGGDVTLLGPRAPVGPGARLTDLARALRTSGTPVRRVLVDDGLYPGPRTGPDWKPGYVTSGNVAPVDALSVDDGRADPRERARVPDPALAAGQALARLVGAPPAGVVRASAPAGAAVLAEVTSPTVPELVERMLTTSDNDLAESLTRQVALTQHLPATFAGGARAVAQVLGPLLVDPAAVALVDGSGLSPRDRVQPGALARLLAAVAKGDQPRLAPLLSGLPVAGFDGTLAERYRRPPEALAAGQVRAKTGTLTGVSTLAGLVRTRDGRLLAFDAAADAVPEGATVAAEAALDRLAAALAGCGCA